MMSVGRPCLFFFERLSARKELRSGSDGKRGIGQVQLSFARLLAIFPPVAALRDRIRCPWAEMYI